MPRTPRGPIDELAGYTILDLDGPTLPQDDYYEMFTPAGLVTVWGVGLITLGGATDQEIAWMANVDTNSDLSTFPGDWISFGFTSPVQQAAEIEIWPGGMIAGLRFTDQGVSGADAWSIGGYNSAAGASSFYWSDFNVTNGSSAGETLTAGADPATLNGLGGDDTLIGGTGSDALHGGDGNDHLIGGAGADRLWGDGGNDVLEPGSDSSGSYLTFLNRAGVYFVDGGPGFDTLVLDYSAAGSQSISGDQILASPQVVNVEALSITGSPYSDFLSGSSSDDKLFGGGGFDFLSGGAGNDWLDAGAPGASSVTVVGEGGHSTADALSLDHLFTAGSGGPSVTLSFQQTEYMVNSWGLRPFAGNIYSFTVAQAGEQAFIDYVLGPSGSGGGLLYGFTITDENGVQVDWYPYDPTTPIVFPHAGTYYLQVDIINTNVWGNTSIDVTLSLQGGDVLTSNVLAGGSGDDTYVVYSPIDQVIENPGEGTDTVLSSVSWTLGANVENLTLTGSSAIDGTGNSLANQIIGNSAANVISGGGGADILAGGGGADTLSGGAGPDIFRFTALSDSAPGAADLIQDFSSRSMVGKALADRIDLSAIDANVNKAGDQAFTLVSKFTGHAGQLYSSYDSQANVTHIYMDVNGDRLADMTIDLAGQVKLTAADFLL